MSTNTLHDPATPQSNDSGPSALDIEGVIYDVGRLAALGQWIETARWTIELIEAARSYDHDLDARLRAHDIRTTDWDEETSAGLYILLRSVRDTVGGLGVRPGAASSNTEASHAQG